MAAIKAGQLTLNQPEIRTFHKKPATRAGDPENIHQAKTPARPYAALIRVVFSQALTMKTRYVLLSSVFLIAGCDKPKNDAMRSVPSAPATAGAEDHAEPLVEQRGYNGNLVDTKLKQRLEKLGLTMQDFVEFQNRLKKPPFNKYKYPTEGAFDGLANCSPPPPIKPNKIKLFDEAAVDCLNRMDALKKSYDEAQQSRKVASREELDNWLEQSANPTERAFAYLASGDPTYLSEDPLPEDASSLEVYAAIKSAKGNEEIKAILEKAHKGDPTNSWFALKLASLSSATNDGQATYQYLLEAVRGNNLIDPFEQSLQMGRKFLESLEGDSSQLKTVTLTKSVDSVAGVLINSIGDLTKQADEQFKADSPIQGSTTLSLALGIAQLAETSDDLGAKAYSVID